MDGTDLPNEGEEESKADGEQEAEGKWKRTGQGLDVLMTPTMRRTLQMKLSQLQVKLGIFQSLL